MKIESTVWVKANGVGLSWGLACLAAMSILHAHSVRAAGPGGSSPAGKSPWVTLESVPGSPVPRVILAARATQRLGIETGKVREAVVARSQMVGGQIVPPMKALPAQEPAGASFGGFGGFGGFGQAAPRPAPAAKKLPPSPPGSVWVQVSLTPGEWERLAHNKPARVLALDTREKLQKEVLARPIDMQPIESMKRSMLWLFYAVPGKDHGLTVGERMRLELPLAGGDESKKEKVVPYGAVYYDAKGAAWVYVNGAPNTYMRQHVGIARIVGELAVLNEGPPVGASVVTVGAALLYGTEIFKK